jgi:hypothetical protein
MNRNGNLYIEHLINNFKLFSFPFVIEIKIKWIANVLINYLWCMWCVFALVSLRWWSLTIYNQRLTL